MIKKFFSLVIFMCLLLFPGLLSNAESSIILQDGGKTYSIEQASLPGSSYPYSITEEEDSISIIDADSGINADANITCMNKSTADALRNYYNDSGLSDEEAFNNLVDISESYIDAALESYKTNFLYGTGGQIGTEANMKLFERTSQKLFGQSSDIFVYNTLTSNGSGYSEFSHIDIFVPFHSSFTILNINFTVKGGCLDKNAIDVINNILENISISNLPFQKQQLEILSNSTLINQVNSGIYPSTFEPSTTVNSIVETQQGFSLNYPASLVQYVQNSVADTLYYNSFKVSPDEIFSISIEPAVSPESAAADKVAVIKNGSGTDLNVISEGTNITRSGSFIFIIYTVNHGGYNVYYQDYLAVNNGKLYRLQFESRGRQPSELAMKAFSIIFSSFEFIDEPTKLINLDKIPVSNEMQSYYNEKTGLSFAYPESWELKDTGSESMKLNIPEISDFLDIYISRDSGGKLISIPYMGLRSTLLNCSIVNSRKATYIYKQVNYLDQGSKGRLCSSVEIACNGKIYSMLIDVNSSWVKSGYISDSEIASAVNSIASSFTVK